MDRIRDGGSFTTRRVVAIQDGHAIFNMAASFQIEEDGFDHQDAMPDVTPPDSLPTEEERLAPLVSRLPPALRARALAKRPFDMRVVDPVDPFTPTPTAPSRAVWLRARGSSPTPRPPPVPPGVRVGLLVRHHLLPHGVG